VNRTRYLAASLLFLNGLLHVARVGMAGLDAAFVTTASVFGAVYLVLGVLLLRNAGTAATLGAMVPLAGIVVGLVGGLAGGPATPSPRMALLAALDVAIVLACFRLITARRRAPSDRS
jgi:hypothetical protein